MCNAIGVDPLAGSNVTGKGKKSGKGSWWSQVMGGDVGDFYFGLAVRIVEICRESRGENGGLIGVAECRERVGKGRRIGGGIEVTEYVHSLYSDTISMHHQRDAITEQLIVTIFYGQSSPSAHLAPVFR